MQDLYFDTITSAEIIDGVVKMDAGVTLRDGVEQTVRLRIPLMAFQGIAQGFREALVSFMKQGYYGEQGKTAAGNLKGAKQ